MPEERTDIKQCIFRLPRELAAWLAGRAVVEKTTMNAVVARLLEQYRAGTEKENEG